MDKILAAVDFSEVSSNVMENAALVAEKLAGKLWLLHVASAGTDTFGYRTGPAVFREHRAQELREEHRQLQSWTEEIRQGGIDATALLVVGSPIETILKEALRLKANLIVLGSHGRGAFYRNLLGSVSEGVLRKASCPVLIIPTPNSANH